MRMLAFVCGGTIAVATGQVVLVLFGRAIFPPHPPTEYIVVAPQEHRLEVERRTRAESRLMQSEGENFGLKVDNVILRDQLRRVHMRDGVPGGAPAAIPVAEVEPGDMIPAQNVPTQSREQP